MLLRRLLLLQIAILAVALMLAQPPIGRADEDPPTEDPVPAQPDGTDVQARGPMHEAYAEATGMKGTASPVVTKEPPKAIEESPPEEKPEGANVFWIPGYWAWEDEAKEFIWISGLWRNLPPGRSWTPGHWQKASTGWQWVTGYWGTPAAREKAVEYLPSPPVSLDRGSSAPATAATANSYYVPGIWVFNVNRFLWRPGYHVLARSNWVWIPACYRWTPAGYIFQTGYWDYPLLARGLLFAPCRFTKAVYLNPGFVYRPAYVIQPDFLLGSLFVRTGTRRYYFGNYFEPAYKNNYVSWVNYRPNRVNYDINYSYYRASYVNHKTWDTNLRGLYTARYAGTVARPPVTLVQQTKVVNTLTVNKTSTTVVNKNINITHLQNVSVLQPVGRINNILVTGMASLAGIKPADFKKAPVAHQVKVKKLTAAQVKVEQQSIKRYRAVASERKKVEAKLAPKAALVRPSASNIKPLKGKVVLPKNTPPPRVYKPVKPPTAPNRPKVDPRTLPKVKTPTAPKDKPAPRVLPPKDKTPKAPPKPKDKTTKVPPPAPKDKTPKAPPPPKPKDKTPKAPPPKPPVQPKDKTPKAPPPAPKDKTPKAPPPKAPKAPPPKAPPPKDKPKDKAPPPKVAPSAPPKGTPAPPPKPAPKVPPKDKPKDK